MFKSEGKKFIYTSESRSLDISLSYGVSPARETSTYLIWLEKLLT